jgi:hypothetical protein
VIFVLLPTDGAPSYPLQTQGEDKPVSPGIMDGGQMAELRTGHTAGVGKHLKIIVVQSIL